MEQIKINQKLGEIVTMLPNASEIFKNAQIDFCCGGHRTLKEAVSEKGLDQEVLLNQLNAAYQKFIEKAEGEIPATASDIDLIDSYIMPHHVFTKQILPEISELAGTILRVHGANHRELFTIHKWVRNLEADLEQHLIKEETILFPAIKEYALNPDENKLRQVMEQINETEDEHDTAGAILKELRVITNEYSVPDDGCATYDLTYELIQRLESDLFEHIHLENNILFNRFELKAV